MWSSEAVRRLLLAAAIAGAAALSGCSSLTPVYGEHGVVAERQAYRYARPANRLEQIIYEELKLKLGQASGPADPLVTIATTVKNRDLTRSRADRADTQHEAVVTADISVADASGAVIYKAQRSASASYTTDGQGLADTEAARSAAEQAAKALADTVRLTLLGALATR